ncbi:MAG: hypothetical protein J5J00_03435, partial [Deltaproteobacteria bacterium]|nr:hypothetical protein [Deltaproteobacteria bacterium]
MIGTNSRGLTRKFVLLNFLLISLSFLAVLPPKYWLIESFANFGLYLLFCHLAASGAVHFLTAFNGRTRALFSSVNLAFVALFSLPLIPLYSGAQPPLPRHWPELRILYANVQTSNRDKESLL